MGGFDCGECRSQYASQGREHAVPCDDERGCPFTPSPGDIGPDGCGLSPDNSFVAGFYGKWKSLGEAAFQLIDLTFETSDDSDMFVEKLMLIEEHAPLIAERRKRREEAEQKKIERREQRRKR